VVPESCCPPPLPGDIDINKDIAGEIEEVESVLDTVGLCLLREHGSNDGNRNVWPKEFKLFNPRDNLLENVRGESAFHFPENPYPVGAGD
jgi:hypothetical protein